MVILRVTLTRLLYFAILRHFLLTSHAGYVETSKYIIFHPKVGNFSRRIYRFVRFRKFQAFFPLNTLMPLQCLYIIFWTNVGNFYVVMTRLSDYLIFWHFFRWTRWCWSSSVQTMKLQYFILQYRYDYWISSFFFTVIFSKINLIVSKAQGCLKTMLSFFLLLYFRLLVISVIIFTFKRVF